MLPEYAVLFGFLFLAVLFDLRERRIPNRLCLSGMLAGMGLRTVLRGVPGFLSGVAGIGLAILPLFLLFRSGMLGAGDIKLFAVVGSFMGPGFLIRHIPQLKGLPVITGADFGHTTPIATLPLGGHCIIRSGQIRIDW